MAQLCALDVRFSGVASDVRSFTFGAPRIGDAAFAELLAAYTAESWRFTHNRDIVPSVPLEVRRKVLQTLPLFVLGRLSCSVAAVA